MDRETRSNGDNKEQGRNLEETKQRAFFVKGSKNWLKEHVERDEDRAPLVQLLADDGSTPKRTVCLRRGW